MRVRLTSSVPKLPVLVARLEPASDTFGFLNQSNLELWIFRVQLVGKPASRNSASHNQHVALALVLCLNEIRREASALGAALRTQKAAIERGLNPQPNTQGC